MISGDVNENESDLPVEIELPIEIESSTEAFAEPFDAVKLALEANLHPATHHESQLDAVLEEDTQGEAPVARPAARKGGKVCGTKLSNGDHCVLKPFHLGNCEPPITKGTTTPAMQTYAGAVNDLYRKQEKSPTFVHQGEKVVAFPDDMGTPDDVETESNESYVPPWLKRTASTAHPLGHPFLSLPVSTFRHAAKTSSSVAAVSVRGPK